MRKEKRETVVNVLMIGLVFVVAAGSGAMVYKNLLDKEARERNAALEKKAVHFENFVVVQPFPDSDQNQANGFIMLNGKMYQTDSQTAKPMTQNILLPGKTKVMVNGRIILDNGTSRVLGNNEMITWNGDVILSKKPLTIIK
jgi:hypothetical protein